MRHGAAGEKQNIDGLVTNTSNAGVCEARRHNHAAVCLTGKAGVRPNIDGLVTNTSKAGVRCEAKHGAAGEKQVCVRQHGSR